MKWRGSLFPGVGVTVLLTVLLVGGGVALSAAVAASRQDGAAGWVSSFGDDSPPPAPSAEHRALFPSVLRESAASPPLDIPTPTPTRSPTPTPTANETPTSAVVRVLPNHTHYVDHAGVLHIVGDVRNGSGREIGTVEISVTLLRVGGEPCATVLGKTYLKRQSAGEETCFDIALEEMPDWASYASEAPTHIPVEGSPLDLTILNDSGSLFLRMIPDRW